MHMCVKSNGFNVFLRRASPFTARGAARRAGLPYPWPVQAVFNSPVSLTPTPST